MYLSILLPRHTIIILSRSYWFIHENTSNIPIQLYIIGINIAKLSSEPDRRTIKIDNRATYTPATFDNESPRACGLGTEESTDVVASRQLRARIALTMSRGDGADYESPGERNAKPRTLYAI